MSTNDENLDNTEHWIDDEEQRLKYRQVINGFKIDAILNTYDVSQVIDSNRKTNTVTDHTDQQTDDDDDDEDDIEHITKSFAEQIEISDNEIENELDDKELETETLYVPIIDLTLESFPSHVIYYESTDVQTNESPIGLVFGNIGPQLETNCDQYQQVIHNLNISSNCSRIIMIKFDKNNMKLKDDLLVIYSANDLLRITANNDALARVCGQTGDGFIFGSKSCLLIMSRLLVSSDTNDITPVQYKGKHSIELDSGFTSFVICGSLPHNTVLIHTANTFKIDYQLCELCANISSNQTIIGDNLTKSIESNQQTMDISGINQKLSDVLECETQNIAE